MKKLDFYDVDKNYINYLKEEEIKHRGFTRVPDVEYKDEKKFLCGIVLEINGVDYYVPVSSYKKQKPDNFLIVLEDDKYNKVKGSLRFNYMIPVPKSCVKRRIINDEKKPSRRLFLHRQLVYINENVEVIMNRARRTYLRVINNYSPTLTKNSCDFKFLEKKCLEYEGYLESLKEAATSMDENLQITNNVQEELEL